MKKLFFTLSLILAVSLMFSGCSNADNEASEKTNTEIGSSTTQGSVDISSFKTLTPISAAIIDEADKIGEYDTTSSPSIVFANSIATVSGSGLVANGTVVTVSQPGTYIVSGKCSEASILVNKGVGAVVFVLNGCELSNSTTAVIYSKKGNKITLNLAENTENIFSDAVAYVGQVEEEPNACIFIKTELVINGKGKLTVHGNFNNAIQSKGALVICGGTIVADAVSETIRGKDYVEILDGNLTLTAGSDGIQSSSEEGENLGYVRLSGGEITISAGSSAIDAVTSCEICGSNLNVTSSAHIIKSAKNIIINSGSVKGNSIEDGIKAENDLLNEGSIEINGGEINISSGYDGICSLNNLQINGGSITVKTTGKVSSSSQSIGGGYFGGTTSSATTTANLSSKGIKTDGTMQILGGTIFLNTTDHAIHSTSTINIGETADITITSSLKGISGHGKVTIFGGIINITKSTEGIESKSDLTINDGTIHLVASDDGLNSGNDSTTTTSTHNIYINGGLLYINSAGDGIDSNSTITINGGTVIVDGPTNNGNGAMDCDGQFTVNGGTLIAVGSSGMAQAPTSGNQCSVKIGLSISAGSLIHIQDASGNNVLTYSPKKSVQNLVFSSSKLVLNNSYTIYTSGSYSSNTNSDGVYSGGTYTAGTLLGTMTLTSNCTSYNVPSTGGGWNTFPRK